MSRPRRFGIERAEIIQRGELTEWEYDPTTKSYMAWIRVFFTEVRDGVAKGPFEYAETARIPGIDAATIWTPTDSPGVAEPRRGSRGSDQVREKEVALTTARMAVRLRGLREKARERGFDLVVVARPATPVDRDVPPGDGGGAGD